MVNMKKLICPLIQSQRDSRWVSILLGFNTNQPYTIGNYGCLITCFGNYIGKTPAEVNQILKDNAGFTSGGLFVWSKSTVLGLNPYYTSPRYEDAVSSLALTKMKSLIDEGRPLICEIDFNPTTVEEDMHYVLVIGYDETQEDKFLAVDPWTGTEIDLSVYGGVKRTLYQFRAYDKTLPFFTNEEYYLGIDLSNKESVKVCVQTWKDVIDGKYIKKEDCDKLIQNATIPLKQTVADKESTISNLNGQISQLEKDKLSLSTEIDNLLKTVKDHEGCQTKIIEATNLKNQAEQDLAKSRGDWQLKEVALNKQIALLTTKYNATKSSVKKLLVDYIFGKTV